jgi:hypothetical protein
MPEHFTKNTVEAKFYCGPCNKPTMRYIFDGRRGGCQECIKRRESEPKRDTPAVQEFLFGGEK